VDVNHEGQAPYHGTVAVPMQPVLPDAVQKAGEALKLTPESWRIVEGGYTNALKYIVTFSDGSSFFVKSAADDETAKWLRAEYQIYSSLSVSFLPHCIAWIDQGHPILVLEDLSAGMWPPPWREDMIQRTLSLLSDLAQITPVLPLPSLASILPQLNGWKQIATDPKAFLNLGFVTSAWWDRSFAFLCATELHVSLEGDSLVHTDIRSDNLCFLPDRTVLIDWNWAVKGNPEFDKIYWLGTAYAENALLPWEYGVTQKELVVALAGFYAHQASLPAPAGAFGTHIRGLQSSLAKAFIDWAIKVYDLPVDSTGG